MLKLNFTTQFKRDMKAAQKQGLDMEALYLVIGMLQRQEELPEKYRDHKLVNSKNYKGMRECHIQPDWLLVYKVYENDLVLELVRTGSHSELLS